MRNYDILAATPMQELYTQRQSPLLISVSQAAEILGVSQSSVRQLINSGRMAHVRLGISKKMIPEAALKQFIEANTVTPCHAETMVIASDFSKSAVAITSSGVKVDAARSAALAQRTAKMLKLHSRTSSGGNQAE